MGGYSLPVGVHYNHVAANGLGLKQDLLYLDSINPILAADERRFFWIKKLRKGIIICENLRPI